ncbi:MAG: hypothetical protein BTN85_0214 [Candidatus Methanohalarchaeum thermophilum]|uniref:Uncharacterized protein n=1 Tax=Methanohalarchaeum thermophilum TaxID=1903181 RepID=A0A1Q6DTS1_METT1|nr:MAG: hypothetical protein BTN85_0214 [Candidatus Methanohalarchaeum thermophilum]
MIYMKEEEIKEEIKARIKREKEIEKSKLIDLSQLWGLGKPEEVEEVIKKLISNSELKTKEKEGKEVVYLE